MADYLCMIASHVLLGKETGPLSTTLEEHRRMNGLPCHAMSNGQRGSSLPAYPSLFLVRKLCLLFGLKMGWITWRRPGSSSLRASRTVHYTSPQLNFPARSSGTTRVIATLRMSLTIMMEGCRRVSRCPRTTMLTSRTLVPRATNSLRPAAT